MKTIAIIAEYNPFHLGHAYQLARARELSGADKVVVLMSGDFVQRGEPAILDKYERTRFALDGGANLVLCLPLAAACGSAWEFADGAVAILDALGFVDELWFGSECGDIAPLLQLARILAAEPEPFSPVLRAALSAGASYPAAQEAAVRAVFAAPADLHALLSLPNNALAITYITSLLRRQSDIRPRTLRRVGAPYHSLNAAQNGAGAPPIYCSAAAIRQAAREGNLAALRACMPEETFAALSEDPRRLLFPDDFSQALFYQLLMEPDLTQYAGVTAELQNRIRRALPASHSFTALVDAVASRNWPRSRVSRALAHILLRLPAAPSHDDSRRAAAAGTVPQRVPQAENSAAAAGRPAGRQGALRPMQTPPAVQVLGLNGADELFAQAAARGRIQLQPRVAALPAPYFAADLRAANLCAAVRAQKTGAMFREEHKRRPEK